MDRIINHQNVELRVGDEIKIISDRISNKLLANVSEGDTITITSFSEDRCSGVRPLQEDGS